MPRYLSLADALLVSLRRDPGYAMVMPSKVQSYIACAKPSVAAVDGEAARILRESQGGFTVGAEDPDALARPVLSLPRMAPEDRREMGRRNRRYFEEHFDRQRLVDRSECILREVGAEGPAN